MPDTKVTGLGTNSTPDKDDLLHIVDDPGGTPANQKITLSNLAIGGDVRLYGANTTPGTTDMTTPIQNCIDENGYVRLQPETYLITDTILLDSDEMIFGHGKATIIKGNLTKAMIAGVGAPSRTHRSGGRDFLLDNTARTNANSIALDLLSVSRSYWSNILIQNVETAIRIGGSTGAGAFYNDFHGVLIETVDVGYEQGTLANENHVFGGTVNDCEIGTRDNDNSNNSYYGLSVEVFTTAAHISASTATTQFIKYIGSRLENANTSSPWDASIGFDLGASSSILAASTFIYGPQITQVFDPYRIDSNTVDYHIWDDTQFIPRGGHSLKQVVARGSETINFPSINANDSNDQNFTVTGVVATDTVIINPDAAVLVAGITLMGMAATDTIHIRAANVTTGAINLADQSFNYVVLRFAAAL